MKHRTVCLIAILMTTILSGCASNNYSERQSVGAVTGAVLGGLLGAEFGGKRGNDRLVTTGIGVFLGSLIGSEIGRSMDDVDRMRANEANARAQTASLGEKITWNNPEKNHYGSVTPVRDGRSESGNYCREFHQTVTIGGKTEDAYGQACRQPDGSWRIVEN